MDRVLNPGGSISVFLAKAQGWSGTQEGFQPAADEFLDKNGRTWIESYLRTLLTGRERPRKADKREYDLLVAAIDAWEAGRAETTIAGAPWPGSKTTTANFDRPRLYRPI